MVSFISKLTPHLQLPQALLLFAPVPLQPLQQPGRAFPESLGERFAYQRVEEVAGYLQPAAAQTRRDPGDALAAARQVDESGQAAPPKQSSDSVMDGLPPLTPSR